MYRPHNYEYLRICTCKLARVGEEMIQLQSGEIFHFLVADGKKE